jgi:hypothetical protein
MKIQIRKLEKVETTYIPVDEPGCCGCYDC